MHDILLLGDFFCDRTTTSQRHAVLPTAAALEAWLARDLAEGSWTCYIASVV